MPTPRGDVMCDAFGELFVAVGGFYDPTNQFLSNAQRSEVEAFNPASGGLLFFIMHGQMQDKQAR